ncbi:MAG: helix-turn-helix transcriptional regulator [Labedaea sp.]
MTGGRATTERVLRLLALLQSRPVWTGAELAGQLGVTDRCVRRDVDRLRELGYPVNAAQGPGGGYQLGAGRSLPPLLLADDEAIAMAISLRLAAGGTVADASEPALRALTKLDQVMPQRLRGEVRAVTEATATLIADRFSVDSDLLVLLARACRDRTRVRFVYETRAGVAGERTVEPVRLVATARRWYLMAWDVDRDDWRTFRLDRTRAAVASTWRFRAREHPDPVAFVQQGVTAAPYRHVVRALVAASLTEVGAVVPPQVASVEAAADGRTLLVSGSDDLDSLAFHLARLPWPVDVLEPAELTAAAHRLAKRLQALGPA